MLSCAGEGCSHSLGVGVSVSTWDEVVRSAEGNAVKAAMLPLPPLRCQHC